MRAPSVEASALGGDVRVRSIISAGVAGTGGAFPDDGLDMREAAETWWLDISGVL